MASKMGNLKQYADREVVTKTDFNNLCAEMSGDPIIGHEITTGNRSDSDLGDVSSGVTGHIIKDIYQREGKKFKIVDSSGKIIKVIDLNDLEEEQFGILAGKSKASGFPDFLLAGGGVNKYFTILGAATKLEIVIDGVAYDLEADVQSNVLGLAPAANNTCLVNDANIAADPIWSKTIGEYGYWIIIDTVGSEITALNGTIQCFKINNGVDTEVFIATVDTTNNRIIPILRGIGGTARIAFSNNDTITVLKGHYIFLDDNLTTIDTAVNYPKWQYAAPAAPVAGDYWFKTSERVWYRYSGAAWEKLGRIYLGYGICDSVGCLWVEHGDYNLIWNELLVLNGILSKTTTSSILSMPLSVSVGETKILINTEKILDLNTDLEGGQSKVISTWYYIYVATDGNIILSWTTPRKYDNKLGRYHPTELWRAIGMLFYGSGGILWSQVYDARNGIIDFETSASGVKFTTLPAAGGPLAFTTTNLPAIVQNIQIEINFGITAGNIAYLYAQELALYTYQNDSKQKLMYCNIPGENVTFTHAKELGLIRNTCLNMSRDGFPSISNIYISKIYIKF